MNIRILITCGTGAAVVLGTWFFIDHVAAGFFFIIFLTLALSVAISDDAKKHLHPGLFVSLADDAQTVIVENLGTAPAQDVKVRIIPDDIRYEIGTLAPDEKHRYELPAVISRAKAAVSWERKDGTRSEKITRLSGYDEETDPLRPVFPLFNWKEKETKKE